jgi:hypothetical protein
MSMAQTPLSKTLEILQKDRSIKRYALIECLTTIPFQILLFGFLGLIAVYLSSGYFPSESLIYHPLVLNLVGLLVILTVISIPLLFYLQERFSIAAMYNAHDYLLNRKSDGFNKSKGKVLWLFISLIKAKFIALKLSTRRLKKAIKTGKNIDGEIKMYDEKFIAPILLFQNKSLDEAVEESAKYYTRDFWSLLKQEFKFAFGIHGIGVLIASVVFLSFIFAFPFLYGLLLASIVVSGTIGTFFGLLNHFSRPVFIVVLYHYVKKNLL